MILLTPSFRPLISRVRASSSRVGSGAVPCAGPPGRENWEMRGRGPRPGHTLFTLPEGDGAGDWVGEARGLLAS